jgi:hypothetical protein
VCWNGATVCRCRYHGVAGMHRWVSLGVIADNLMNIATFTRARAHRIAEHTEMRRSVRVPAAVNGHKPVSGHFFTGK